MSAFNCATAPPAIKLAKTLVSLGENYGEVTDRGTRIYNLDPKDLANVSDISPEDSQKLLGKLVSKHWIEIDEADESLYLLNLKQLAHLAGHMG